MAIIWEILIFKGLTTFIWKENKQANKQQLWVLPGSPSRVELISGDILPEENMVE